MATESDVEKLFESISKCEGCDKCYGKIVLPQPLPVFLRNDGQAKIIVITEQPGERLVKDIVENRKEIAKKIENDIVIKMSEEELKNIKDKNLWEKAVWARFVSIQSKVPGKLREFLGEEFSESIKTRSGEYYWTHYIKCPGQVRRKKGIRENACADTHLVKEILTFKPDIILTFGALPSQWILSLGESSEPEWREYFWNEIQEVFLYEITKNAESGGEREKTDDLKTKLQKISERIIVKGRDVNGEESEHKTLVLVLYHPSGQNPAAYFTKKIFDILNPQKS